jgi:tetratricopeptide (TPR) repeat protein
MAGCMGPPILAAPAALWQLTENFMFALADVRTEAKENGLHYMERLTRLILLWGLLGLTASYVHASTSEENTLPRVISSESEVSSYQKIVDDMESRMGAYAPDLPEKLLSLGAALQKQGRHEEAIRVFKRGTHLARINNGLYSATQIPLIQGEITSYIATGELLEADQRQQYMHSVQLRSLNNPDSRVQALMQQAAWQQSAYQMRLGEQPFVRLLNMWDLYRVALSDIADREGATSVNLLPPLDGLLQAQYLISDHHAGNSGGSSSDTSFGARQSQNRFNAYRSRSYTQGSSVIRAIYDVRKAQAEDQNLATAESLVMLGDWILWHGDHEQAFAAYREALGELAQLDDAQLQIDRIFGKPVALPTIEGVRSLPPEVAVEGGDILLEFTVTERGKVTDLSRLDVKEEYESSTIKLMRKLRSTPFRPRFESMNPVVTEKMTHAYKIGP